MSGAFGYCVRVDVAVFGPRRQRPFCSIAGRLKQEIVLCALLSGGAQIFCTFFSKNAKKELTLCGENGNITKLSPTGRQRSRTLKIEQHSLEIDREVNGESL